MAPATKKPAEKESPDVLRRKAEKKLAERSAEAAALEGKTPETLIHELQVHQIELEMQNEALREAHIASEESRDKYLDLYDFAPVGYLTLSKTAVIQEANLTVATQLGIGRHELIKGRFRTFVVPGNLERWDRHFVAVLRSPDKRTCELKLRKKDGPELYVRLESIRTGMEGEPAVRMAIIDITEQKRGEERLKVFKQFTEHAEDIILFIRKNDGRIIEANRKASLVYGYSHEELLGMTIFTISAHDPKPRVIEQMNHAHATGTLFETLHRRKDGSDVSVEVNSFSLEQEGELIVFAIIRDITDRKMAEVLINQLSEERKTLLDNVPAMIWYKDTHNRFIRVNPAAARTFGSPVGELEGKSAKLLFPEDSEKYYLDDLDVISTARPKYGIIEEMKIASGKKIWVRTDKVPLMDEKGTVTGLLVFAVDITDMKRAEDELIRRSSDVQAANQELTATGEELMRNEARLTESLEEKEALLSEVHHRVKNNLAAFISLLALDGTYEDTPEGKRLKKDLQNRARSMALIHETLYKTRKFSSVDMQVYLSTLTEQIAGTYRSENSLRTFVDAKDIGLDLARATPIGLIVNELITNVFKYAFPAWFDCSTTREEPCTLRISLILDKGIYMLSVADNGIGLPPEFDLATAKSLGLKLVNFLAKHQLRAKVEVTREKGTAFSIRFKEKVGR